MSWPWSKEEDDLLRQHYYRLGAKRVSEMLTERYRPRSILAVYSHAPKVVNSIGIPRGWVPLVDVIPYEFQGRRMAHPVAKRKARADGVLRRARTNTGLTLLVPEAWAEEVASERARAEAENHRTRDWLPTEAVAELFGVHKEHLVLTQTKPRRVHLFAERIERVFVSGGYRWHPQQAREQATMYRQTRRRRRRRQLDSQGRTR